jgi:hypothetical protein
MPSSCRRIRKKEARMPTVVHTIGGETVRLEDSFDAVSSQLGGSETGGFTGVLFDSDTRVTVYRSGIAYIEEAIEATPVGFGN